MSSCQIGPYIVRLRQDPGHQCPLYCVFLGHVLIGKCISVPDLDACKWLERQQREQTFYAYSSATLPARSSIRPSANQAAIKRRVGRPTGEKTQQDIAKALAGG